MPMVPLKPTPLQPREFFGGIWNGEGTIRPHPLVRWLFPIDRFSFTSQAIWLSDAVWMVEEEYQFSSGDAMNRRMFVRRTSHDRLHVTADDMPLGADILLEATGFSFTPYYVESPYRGRRWRLRCVDDCKLDENGVVHDMNKMYFHGILVCTMDLVITIKRSVTPVTVTDAQRRTA